MRLSRFFRRARQILRDEGFLALLRWLASLLFIFERLYVYEKDLTEPDAPSPACKVDNLTIKPIFLPITLAEYEELGRQGFDFTSHPEAREPRGPADKGAIVFWTTVDSELVNRTGMTTIKKGSVYKSIHKFHRSLIDDGRIVYAGFSETAEKHRLKGVYTWVHAKIFGYLKEKGFSRVILLEAEEQVGPRKSQARLGSKVTYEIYLLTILSAFIKITCNIWLANRWPFILIGRPQGNIPREKAVNKAN